MTTRVKNALYITPSDEFKSIIILTPPRRSFDKTYEISYTYKKKIYKTTKGLQRDRNRYFTQKRRRSADKF